MSKLGTMIEVLNNGEIEFDGQIRTLNLSITFRMISNPDQSGTSSPDYLILAKNSFGHEVQLGAAWLKKPNRFGSDQKDFLSITLDDQSFEKPLNVTAFVQADGKTWDITWRRRQEKPNNEAA